MAPTAADVLIETIQDWRVEVVFGLPGDGINGIEEAAALMACLATSGPGGIHLLNGLYDEGLDGQAAKFAKSLLRGEPNSQKIALTVLGDRIRELV